MAHVQKSTKSQVGGLTRHYERFKKENGEYIKFNNQEIDVTKSHLNYNLATHQNMNQLDFIKKRTAEVNCPNRKEINVMCSWVITKPKELNPDAQDLFFQEVYKFLENRYGKENVISAYVHLDETTPHVHFAFVPIKFDEKKQKYKVCAKEVVNRQDLRTFHKDLTRHMENIFKRDIGLINEATKNGNKSIEELKNETKNKILADVTKQAIEKKEVAEIKVQKLNKLIEDCNKVFGTVEEIESIKPKKTITGTVKGVSYDDILKLQSTAKNSLKDSLKLKSLQAKLLEVQAENEKLEKQIPTIKKQIHYARLESDNNKLADYIQQYKSMYQCSQNENKELKSFIFECLKAFKNMPDDLRKQYEPEDTEKIIDKIIDTPTKSNSKSKEWNMYR